MRIKYRILWFEDSYSWLDPIKDQVEEYLEDKGFELDFISREKYAQEDFASFDMIVADYNLSDNEKGSEVIEKIRNHEHFTEILFYSQNGEEAVRKIVANDHHIDGVYCASKDNVLEKLKKLIDISIRKTQNLNNLRGLVMAETSELDALIKEIICTMSQHVEDAKLNERIEKLRKTYGDGLTDLDSYCLPKDFEKLVLSLHFTASFSWRTLESFCKACGRNRFEEYKNEILEMRNLLAHKPEDSSDEKTMRIRKCDGSIVEFEEQDFIDIRQTIRKYKQGLGKLKAELGT